MTFFRPQRDSDAKPVMGDTRYARDLGLAAG